LQLIYYKSSVTFAANQGIVAKISPDLSTFVSNQTVCMSFSEEWSAESCQTIIDAQHNMVSCRCNMLSGSLIGLRKDKTRIQGPDIEWTLPQVEKRSQIYLIVPITMLVFALAGSIFTLRLER
jgi:hypothetical protein